MSKSKEIMKKHLTPSISDAKNLAAAVLLLTDAFNRIEGNYSNIPDCCIEVFVAGRTYFEYKQQLSEKDQRKLDQWGYVPCDDCFKKNKKQEIYMNGTSDIGQMILAVQQMIIRKAERKDERRTSKRTVR